MSDTYKTIGGIAEGSFKEKGSKFLAFAHPVTSEDEIKGIIQEYKKKYYDARHHCFAWQLGTDGNCFRANDDGEPSGTAGKPILGQIHAFELTNVLVVVVRYFGGTKLGTGGLIQAYKQAAHDALAKVQVVQKTVDNYYRMTFDYPFVNDVLKTLRNFNADIKCQDFSMSCRIDFCISISKSNALNVALQKIDSVNVEFLYFR